MNILIHVYLTSEEEIGCNIKIVWRLTVSLSAMDISFKHKINKEILDMSYTLNRYIRHTEQNESRLNL